ncbi:bacterial alpha-L-rhamnosidase-domain-containing protein [Plectosphaerella plurivora]|uniref:alpha-L-rhamnosidase n=1 Tax=Plectosphaerella plurivora TaxID=936078 RepID=A0A9P9AFG6_9PEZI|nr:bacterial alpha-L-rhamnosidase-domain-containing protein [Plectosphaerella plurivora]
MPSRRTPMPHIIYPSRQEPGIMKITDLRLFKAESNQSLYLEWPSAPLESRQSAFLRVRAQSQDQEWTEWTEELRVEAALLEPEDWQCSLIRPLTKRAEGEPLRPALFRQNFHLTRAPHSARLYITAQGIYEAYINGSQLGDHVLAPGWTSYDHELPYQTFNVISLLQEGSNVISAEVAEGWFCGRLGFMGGQRDIWGSSVGLLAQLMVTYEDGSVQIVGTDDSWKSGTGPLLQAEIYNGEVFDARLDIRGWQSNGFVDDNWEGVEVRTMDLSILRAQDSPPVRRIETLAVKEKIVSPSGKVILDFGQNLVGWVRCKLSGPAGHRVRLTHVEVLEKGEIATAPLREAKCTDEIILSRTDLVYEPRFTFHGFRYVQVDGYTPEEVKPNDFTAIVIHSDMERTGWFECSDPMLNKLHENVVWSTRGNFVSVPTDCPQRDERLGWTGDLQAFAPTASFLYSTNGMLKSWLRGLSQEQMDDANAVPPLFSPNIWKGRPNIPSAIWGDAIISVPWDLYQASGDTALLEDLFSQMSAWMEQGVKRDEDGLWDPNHPQLGDWLEPTAPADDPGNGPTDEVLVSNVFLIRMTDLMAEISKILGHTTQSTEFVAQAKSLREHFARNFITSSGRVVSDTQTALALAIHFSLFPTPHQQEAAGNRLIHLIRRNARFKIATGFAGTPILGHALSKIGQEQIFYRMLMHRKPPSWLYPITMGATTVWERWDSMLPDGSLNASSMTSFNHYALGAVAGWMHSNIAGFEPLEPGWKRIRIAPRPGGNLTTCHARFRSPYGEVVVEWKLEGGRMYLTAYVPGNVQAEITLPGAPMEVVGSGRHCGTRNQLAHFFEALGPQE